MPPTRFADRTASTALCRCGHARSAHKHFRRGTDCGTGGAEHCFRFRASESLAVRTANRFRPRPLVDGRDLAPVVALVRPRAANTRRSA